MIVLLLMAPDLGEASIGGVITVRRQLEEAKAGAARAQADAAEVRGEIAGLQAAVARAELVATQQLSAQQHTTVTAGTDTVAVLEWLSAKVGLGVTGEPDRRGGSADMSGGTEDLPDVAEARVAIANRAFEAISGMLPPGWASGTLVGIVEGEPRVLYVTGASPARDPEEQLEQAGVLHSAALTGRPAGVEGTNEAPALAAAPVLNAAGRRVGMLGVVAHPDAAAGFDPALGAQLEQAAEAFARIVIDLLRLHDDGPSSSGSSSDQAD